MAGNGCRNCWKWLEMAGMAENCKKLLELQQIAGNDLKWLKMAGNCLTF